MRPYVRRAATAVMLWVLLVTLAKGYESVDLQNDPEMEQGLSVQPPESPTYQSLKFQCIRRGNFPVPGSCKDFYQCEELPGYGIMPVLFTCPAGKHFDKNLGVCNLPSQVINRADCSDLNRESARIEDRSNNFPTTGMILENTRTLSRQKTAATLAVLGNVLTAASLGVGLYNAFKPANGIDISGIESKLSRIEAQLNGMNLQLFINQIKSNVISKIILKEVLKNNRTNFKDTPDLIHEGISQRNLNAAIIQGLIVQGNAANEKQFSEVHQSIGKLKEFVRQEMVKINSEIQKGYTSDSTSIDKVGIKPLVSTLLTSIKEFHSRINRLLSLPEKNKKDEMEKSGGYIDYLQSTTLHHTLWDIIHRKLAIPTSVSDTSAVFILDLLVDGLQIQTSILSAIVSSNIYLAIKAHEERNLEDFNTYMQRVNSSIETMRLYLGFDSERSLSKKVNAVIDSVRPYAYQITGLDELLSEKQLVLEQLESKMSQFIEENTQMEEPGMIQRIPDFRDSSVSIPFGPWESGKQVRYAIQLVSKSKISPVGVWSQPYTVSDKANPTIYFPRAKEGVQHLLYRRFNEEKPELVAIVSNNEQTSLKDFGRDLINAASRHNQDLAVTEVQVLLEEEDVDVDITLENNMTPLHYAAKYNNVEVMKLLLNRSADIHARSSDNETPLHFASLLGNNDALEYLISEGAQVNEQTTLLGWSPLHIATAKDHLNTAKILIRNNALINIKDNKGLTPLHLSIQGNGGTMEILLAESTTDVNVQDNEGQTPLHHAARSSTFYSVKQLLKHPEIEVDALSDSHMSPLHCAAMSGNVEIIEELLISNASLFLADEGGSTPLHYAAFYGNKDAALKLAVRNESLISVKNKDGETALDQAVENNNNELIWILKNETETPETQEASGQSRSAEKAETEYTLKDVSCTEQTVQEMVVQSGEICAQMGHIANYIEIIVSQIPIRYREEEALADIIDTYNDGLQKAKTNANRWRNRDSILGGIQLTFRLVKAFEGSFNRKYKITEDSILALSSTSNGEEGVEATEIMREISKLKSDINRTESALTRLTSSDTDMKVYLEYLLRESKADLETKERVISTGPTILPKLEELLYFLEIVSEEANKIKEKAATIKQRINNYSVKVNEDKALFDDIGQKARRKLADLERRSLRNNGELASIRDAREQLEDEVGNYRRTVSGLSNEIYNTQRELRGKRWKLMKQYELVNRKKFIAALMVPLFFISIPLMLEASHEDQLLIKKWQSNLKTTKEEAERIERLIEEKEHLIVQHRETIANGSRNSQPLVRELNIINKLEYDLKNIIVELPIVQPSLEQAEAGLHKIEDVFTHIAQAFADMIDIGKAAKTEEEIKNALNSIHERLSTLQCKWKGSDLYVTDMRSCSKQH